MNAASLPPEILAEIFTTFRRMTIEADRHEWTVVNAVCRAWRAAALGESSLWTYVEAHARNLEQVRAYVARSKTQLLRVELYVGRDDDLEAEMEEMDRLMREQGLGEDKDKDKDNDKKEGGDGDENERRDGTDSEDQQAGGSHPEARQEGKQSTIEEVVAVIMPESYRVRALMLDTLRVVHFDEDIPPSPVVEALLRCAFPALEELYVGLDMGATTLVPFLATCTKLRVLAVEYLQPYRYWEDDPPATRPTVEMWRQVLANMPNLEYLGLDNAIQPEWSGVEPVLGQPDEQSLLRLDRLKDLVIVTETKTMWECARFLHHLSIPPTARVHFNSSKGCDRTDITLLFAQLGGCLARNGDRALCSLELDESKQRLEAHFWDAPRAFPACSKEQPAKDAAPAVRLCVQTVTAGDMRHLHAQVAALLRGAFALARVEAVRLLGLWSPREREYEAVRRGVEVVPLEACVAAFGAMTGVKTLIVGRNTQPKQIDTILGTRHDSGAGGEDEDGGALQPPSMPFPKLEELILANTCWYENIPYERVGPCGMPYERIVRAVQARKDRGCGIRTLRIWDVQDASCEPGKEASVDTRLRAAVSELDVQRSLAHKCSLGFVY